MPGGAKMLKSLRFFLPLLLWACDDQAQGEADAGRAPDFRLGGDGRVGDANPQDGAAPDSAVDPGDAGPDADGRECLPGDRVCLGATGFQLCTPEGRWGVDRCAEGEVCVDGACAPDPRNCLAGERTCLDIGTPGLCQPGVGFEPTEACPEGTICGGDGRCLSPECASAEGFRSYLGCDFLAVDLPNIAYAPFGGTPDSPVGIVVANPNLDSPLAVTLQEADGSLTPLVAEVTIRTVGLPFDPAMPVAVRTEVWDGSRQIVLDTFAEADGLEVPPGGMAVLLVRHHGYAASSQIRAHARRLTTDRPAAVYQFGPYCCNYSYSNDASLLYPVPTLGTDYLNVGVPAWSDVVDEMDPGNPNPPSDEFSGLSATLSVVAPYNNTRVEVTLPPDADLLEVAGNRVARQGNTFTFTLQAHEIADLLSTKAERRPGRLPLGIDLTGARVTASKPVAVFSGHECTFYPQDQGACDHLEEQLLPVDTWGNRIPLVPPILRAPNPAAATEAIYWKIVGEPNTQVRLSRGFSALDPRAPGFLGVPDCQDQLVDDTTIDLGPHGYCEFGTRAAVQLDAERPILVMGIISGQNSTGVFNAFGAHAGDPAIYIAPPVSQFRLSYSFLAPGTFFNDYLTIIAPPTARITLDGQAVDLANTAPVTGTDFVFKHIPISDGPHRVDGDVPFGILVFAFDDYVSYAFTGGLNLNKR